MYTRYAWTLKQTFRAIIQHRFLFLMGLLLAGLALSIPMLLITVSASLNQPIISIPTQTELTIFTDRNTPKEQLKALSQKIASFPEIQSVDILEKKDAFALVAESLGLKNNASKQNPLPDIVIASAKQSATSEDLANVSVAIGKLKYVDNVAYDDQWQRYVTSLFNAMIIVLAIMGSIILALVLLVIFASVRLTTTAQEDEVRALWLFGATPIFIKRPYAWRGAITLICAALFSLLLTDLSVRLLAQPLADFASLYGVKVHLKMLSYDWCLLYIGCAALFGSIVGAFAADRSIRRVQARSIQS